jgi:hypothetical protein
MKIDPQIYPSPKSPKGFSKWFAVKRKHFHICCSCLDVHELEQKILESPSGLVVMERWRESERETEKERKKWSKQKMAAWLRFSTLD